MIENKKILIYGYGNPGRQDDGLGNFFVEEMKTWSEINKFTNFEFDSNYQLNIEEAELMTHYDLVIFADASIEETFDDFLLSKVNGQHELSFTSHAASPAYIYLLAEQLFGKAPETFLLHIKGYEFEFLGKLTSKAEENLKKALEFIQIHLKSNTLHEVAVEMNESTLS